MTMKELYYVGDVTADNYAGGMIGFVTEYQGIQDPNVLLFPDKIQKILVAGTVTINNQLQDRISVWANGEKKVTDIGQAGYLRVFADMQLKRANGSGYDTYTYEGLKEFFPKGFTQSQIDAFMEPQFADRTMLLTETFYSGTDYENSQMGFTQKHWDYSSLSAAPPKMPYVKAVNNGKGIPVPAGTTVIPKTMALSADLAAPYPSGVDTLNLELSSMVSESGTWTLAVEPVGAETMAEPETDLVGVQAMAEAELDLAEDTGMAVPGGPVAVTEQTYTIDYDYKTPIRVILFNGTERYEMQVDPSLMRRTVMTYGEDYYYLTNSGVRSSQDTWEGDYIHLMNGQALTMDGQVLDLENGNTTAVDCRFAIHPEATPFSSTQVGNVTLASYGTYSEVSDEEARGERASRVLMQDGEVYSLPVSDPLYADSFILDHYGEDVYFSVVNQGGQLEHIQTPLAEPENLKETSIAHMSNNLECVNPWALIRYKDGTVAGFNYLTGESLGTFEAMEMPEENGQVDQDQGFIDYASDSLSQIFGGYSSEGVYAVSKNTQSYQASGEFMKALQTAVSKDAGLNALLGQGSFQEDALRGTGLGEGNTQDSLGDDDESTSAAGMEAADGERKASEEDEPSVSDPEQKAGDVQSGGSGSEAGQAVDGQSDSGGSEADQLGGSQSDGGGSEGSQAGSSQSPAGGASEQAQLGETVHDQTQPEGTQSQNGNHPDGSQTTQSQDDMSESDGDAPMKEEGSSEKSETTEKTDQKKAGIQMPEEAYLVAYDTQKGGYEVYNMQDYLNPDLENVNSENAKIEILKNQGIEIDIQAAAGHPTRNTQNDPGIILIFVLAFSVTTLVVVLYQKRGKRKGE
ncbi:MAG: hypothetical protein ACLTKI_08875 [Lachnospiraceae bacterium]